MTSGDASRVVSLGSDDPVPAASATVELATILARAALRLHRRAALAAMVAPCTAPVAVGGEKLAEAGQDPLDLSAELSVHGDRTVDGPERPRSGGSS